MVDPPARPTVVECGAHVWADCPGCGAARHRVVARLGIALVRVECRACGGRHPYMPPRHTRGTSVAPAPRSLGVSFELERYAAYFTGRQLDEDRLDVVTPSVLRRRTLDYSVASLREVDRYCMQVRSDPMLAQNDRVASALLERTVLWGGAYLGEVIRRNVDQAALVIWVEGERAPRAQVPGLRLRSQAVLRGPSGGVLDPIGRLGRCILCGIEHSVSSYANVALGRSAR